MGKKLAIKGHLTRGKEVIELLEMMGGSNFYKHIGNNDETFYYIDGRNNIDCDWTLWNNNFYAIFTLEEFLMEYPFKVGDKVIDKADGCPGVVCEMKWDEDVSDMKYCVAFGNGIDFGWFANDSIDFCKENENLEETQSNQDIDKDVFRKEFCECCGSQRCSGQDDELEYCERFKNLMDNSGKPSDKNHKMGPKSKLPSKYYEDRLKEIESKRDIDKSEFVIKHMILPNKVDDKLEYEIIDGYEFDKIDNNKIILKPIKSKYPKLTNLSECKEILGEKDMYQSVSGYKGELLTNFQLLFIFRDVYWKIAGEQMGLGKPWKPDWKDETQVKYMITTFNNELEFFSSIHSYVVGRRNHILSFPTEEMRDAFCENFKDLIEKCKELL